MSREPEPVGALHYVEHNGEERVVPIQAPGGVLRFSLGTPDAHAAVWRMFTDKNAPEIYLAQRGDNHSKHSFHASGDWRHQYSQARADELGMPRILTRWREPEADDSGRRPVTRILTPSDDIVTNTQPAAKPGKVVWIKKAPPGMLNTIVIDKVSPGGVIVIERRARLVGAMLLPDSTLVAVVHGASPMRRPERELFAQQRRRLAENPPPGTPAPEGPGPHPDYRCEAAAHEGAPDGPLTIWDLKM